MLIIPAIDLYDGACVRLYQGEERQRTVFSAEPLEVAYKWQAAGAKLLHVVDLNGAFEGQPKNLELIKELAAKLSLPIQLGGGMRSEEQVVQALSCGVQRVVLGTIALKNPELVEQMCCRFPNQIVVGIDARDGMVATKGWREASSIPATQLAREYEGSGVASIIFTDISRDGTLKGPNIKSLLEMSRAGGMPLIASGGISSLQDIEQLAESLPQLEGVITGMAIYTKAIDLAAAIDRYQGEG